MWEIGMDGISDGDIREKCAVKRWKLGC